MALWLALLTLMSAPTLAADIPRPDIGAPLSGALEDLRAVGLPVVFSTGVVTPEMRVLVEPRGRTPEIVLEELIAPHGLATEAGAGGAILVLPEPSRSDSRLGAAQPTLARVLGVVRSQASNRPLVGASVRTSGGQELAAGAGGAFVLDLAPNDGPVELTIAHYGHLPRSIEVGSSGSGEVRRLLILLTAAPVVEDELTIATSQHGLLSDTPLDPLAFSRDEILSLPHLGEDLLRAVSLMPGTAANDVSARFHVRGGRRDETQIVLDGQELYEGYHLKDYDDALSLVDAQSIERAELSTGGLPADYGDRLGGVLELTTVRPVGPVRKSVGIGISSLNASFGGGLPDRKGSWFARGRGGPVDLIDGLVGGAEEPSFWDGMAKIDYSVSDRGSVRLNALASGNELEIEETFDRERKILANEYDNQYVWGSYQILASDRLLLETHASFARVHRDRSAFEIDDKVEFNILDARDLDVWEARQTFSLQASTEHAIEGGAGYREFDHDVDYSQDYIFDDPVAALRSNQSESFSLTDRFRERHHSAHLSDRFRPTERLSTEVGLRWDRYSQTDESIVSPRLNTAYRVGERSVLRASWGRFVQSHRPYELLIEDQTIEFQPAERSEHWVLGAEHVFGGADAAHGLVLRVELYRRDIENPRPRYDNLYEPLNNFPEVEPDRVRIESDRALAQGIELFLRGRRGPRVAWWLNYTYAETEDELEGVRFPRPFDQRHSANLDVDVRVGRGWRLNLAWRYHTGWPTTAVSLAEIQGDDGELRFEPELGPLYGERLSEYHRLDLRASKTWTRGFGVISLYIDVQNVYDRRNVAGFDLEIDDEAGVLDRNVENWPGILPSIGLRFDF